MVLAAVSVEAICQPITAGCSDHAASQKSCPHSGVGMFHLCPNATNDSFHYQSICHDFYFFYQSINRSVYKMPQNSEKCHNFQGDVLFLSKSD